MIQKIKTYILGHKIITGIILIGIITGAYFFIFKKTTSGETRYITDVVKKGDVVVTVSGSGQVEASSTIDLKSKTTGDVNYIGVKQGDEVKKGKLIASVDSRDAKLALENAKISLAKLVKEPDSLTLLQKQNSLTKSYSDGWNIASSFLTDANSMLNDIEDMYNNDGFFSNQNIFSLGKTGKSKVDLAEKDYYTSKKSIEEINKIYKTLSRSSSKEEIINLIDISYEASKIFANTAKDTEAAFNYVVNDLELERNTNTTTTRTNINSWLSSSNDYVVNLLSAINSINENTQSLDDLLIGSDALDIRSAELTVSNKQDAHIMIVLFMHHSME